MKTMMFLGLTLLVASVVPAATETKTKIDNRTVTIVRDEVAQTPDACAQAIGENLERAGWHDEIYKSILPDKAYRVYSERNYSGGTLKDVTITLWKAVNVNGKTQIEMWVYKLDPSEVNAFLDTEFSRVASRFKTGTIQ